MQGYLTLVQLEGVPKQTVQKGTFSNGRNYSTTVPLSGTPNCDTEPPLCPQNIIHRSSKFKLSIIRFNTMSQEKKVLSQNTYSRIVEKMDETLLPGDYLQTALKI